MPPLLILTYLQETARISRRFLRQEEKKKIIKIKRPKSVLLAKVKPLILLWLEGLRKSDF